MFLVAEIAVYAVFMAPQMSLALVSVWFLVAFVVQFWGTRSDRVIALSALALMSLVVLVLPLMH
ncbi:hypothetical protein [Isoptericola rhizosphaerae]|uniref:hypothetical protein n=1 Tax=Isoptericola rhizosphaerae TaxID=3377837 RepID=UPI003839FD03